MSLFVTVHKFSGLVRQILYTVPVQDDSADRRSLAERCRITFEPVYVFLVSEPVEAAHRLNWSMIQPGERPGKPVPKPVGSTFHSLHTKLFVNQPQKPGADKPAYSGPQK